MRDTTFQRAAGFIRLLCWGLLSLPVLAQQLTGTITGVVTDTSGGVVTGAQAG